MTADRVVGGVDVLWEIDWIVDLLADQGWPESSKELRLVRAAMAELIEVASRALPILDTHEYERHEDMSVHADLARALANARGGK